MKYEDLDFSNLTYKIYKASMHLFNTRLVTYMLYVWGAASNVASLYMLQYVVAKATFGRHICKAESAG